MELQSSTRQSVFLYAVTLRPSAVSCGAEVFCWVDGIAVCCCAEVVCWTAGAAVCCGVQVVCWTACVVVRYGADVVCWQPGLLCAVELFLSALLYAVELKSPVVCCGAYAVC